MKIEQSSVKHITLAGAPSLDDIQVYLEDISPRGGRVTLTHGSHAWTARWNGIGDRPIERFFCAMSSQYLVDYLNRLPRSEFDPERLQAEAEARIKEMADKGQLSEEEVEELAERVVDKPLNDPWNESPAMEKLFGPEWWYQVPSKATPDYLLLSQVVRAVQSGLEMLTQGDEAPRQTA